MGSEPGSPRILSEAPSLDDNGVERDLDATPLTLVLDTLLLEPAPLRLLMDMRLGRSLWPGCRSCGRPYRAIEPRLAEFVAEFPHGRVLLEAVGGQIVATELTDCMEDVVPDLDRGKERKGGRVCLSEAGMVTMLLRSRFSMLYMIL
jgi:hypothetical protein